MAEAPLTSMVVSPEEVRQAEGHLERLLSEAGARYCLLLDRSGQPVASRGHAPSGNVLTLGALLAGTFAAAREVAKALGEPDFDVFFQQGREESVLTQFLGGQWLLAVFFGQDTPLGLVKVFAGRAARQMEAVLETARVEGRVELPRVRADLRTSIEQAIDDLFKD